MPRNCERAEIWTLQSGDWWKGALIDKGAEAPLSGEIDGLSHESEQGTRYGVSPNPRLPPQL